MASPNATRNEMVPRDGQPSNPVSQPYSNHAPCLSAFIILILMDIIVCVCRDALLVLNARKDEEAHRDFLTFDAITVKICLTD